MTRLGSILGKENCIVKRPELFKEHNNFLLNCYENNYKYRRRTERCKSAWSAVYIIQLQHVPSMFSASWLMFRSKLFRKIAVLKIDPAGHISWHNQVTVHVFCSTVLLALTQTLFCYIVYILYSCSGVLEPRKTVLLSLCTGQSMYPMELWYAGLEAIHEFHNTVLLALGQCFVTLFC